MQDSYTLFFFFFNDTATTEIYTLSLHDALPISCRSAARRCLPGPGASSPSGLVRRFHRNRPMREIGGQVRMEKTRSEEHTSELQSQSNLVCRLLLEKKKKNYELSKIKKRTTTRKV